ncbi:MAG: hypothetical protein Q4C87_05000 [Actinomycetaceae bacterium]|nr:hypothetical protein [Actinomycetaceae bacterium]
MPTTPWEMLCAAPRDDNGKARCAWGKHEFIYEYDPSEVTDKEIARFNEVVSGYADALPLFAQRIYEYYPPEWGISQEDIENGLGAPQVYLYTKPVDGPDLASFIDPIHFTYCEATFDETHIIDIGCGEHLSDLRSVMLDG